MNIHFRCLVVIQGDWLAVSLLTSLISFSVSIQIPSASWSEQSQVVLEFPGYKITILGYTTSIQVVQSQFRLYNHNLWLYSLYSGNTISNTISSAYVPYHHALTCIPGIFRTFLFVILCFNRLGTKFHTDDLAAALFFTRKSNGTTEEGAGEMYIRASRCALMQMCVTSGHAELDITSNHQGSQVQSWSEMLTAEDGDPSFSGDLVWLILVSETVPDRCSREKNCRTDGDISSRFRQAGENFIYAADKMWGWRTGTVAPHTSTLSDGN